jgi:hypothetical protein
MLARTESRPRHRRTRPPLLGRRPPRLPAPPTDRRLTRDELAELGASITSTTPTPRDLPTPASPPISSSCPGPSPTSVNTSSSSSIGSALPMNRTELTPPRRGTSCILPSWRRSRCLGSVAPAESAVGYLRSARPSAIA